MSELGTVHNRAQRIGNGRSGASLAVGALLVFASSAAHSAPTAGDIVKKMADVYARAKSYQVTVVGVQTGKLRDGKSYGITKTESIQYASPNFFHRGTKEKGTGPLATGPVAKQIAQQEGDVFSNGKTAIMYNPSSNLYRKQPSPPKVLVAQLVEPLQTVLKMSPSSLKLLPDSKVRGRAVYVIEYRPDIPANTSPANAAKMREGFKQIKQFPHLMIDKQDFTLAQYSMASINGGQSFDLTSQSIGASIPPRAFAFTPPRGAKEMTAPPPGVMGPGNGPGSLPGRPGVPGAPPRR